MAYAMELDFFSGISKEIVLEQKLLVEVMLVIWYLSQR